MQTLLCLRSDALLKGQCIMKMGESVTFTLYRQLSICVTSFAFVFCLLILKSWVSCKPSELQADCIIKAFFPFFFLSFFILINLFFYSFPRNLCPNIQYRSMFMLLHKCLAVFLMFILFLFLSLVSIILA